MHLHCDSAAGVRFLACVREGRGIKPSARAAGIGKETGYRWLRETFIAMCDQGLSMEQARAELGYSSARIGVWEQQRTTRPAGARHHLAVAADVEVRFWVSFTAGASVDAARRDAGIGRSTAYRWWRKRFVSLREQDVSVRAA